MQHQAQVDINGSHNASLDVGLNINSTGMEDSMSADEKGRGFGNVALAQGVYDWSILVPPPLI